jgi:hypothetical protein
MPPDDIEDFLKRAAQRRQAKAAQTPPAKPIPVAPQRPEYTSARTERVPRNRVENDVPMQAILIDDEVSEPVAKHLTQLKNERLNAAKAAEARRAGGSVRPVDPVVSRPYTAPERAPNVAPKVSSGDNMGFTATDRLITMLRQPEGMMQAILLNEILTRPEHRW